MSVASNMDFFGYEFFEGSTVDAGGLAVFYRVKYDAPVVRASVGYVSNGDGTIRLTVTNMGRKIRASKAEQERVTRVIQVARNYHGLFAKDGQMSRKFK